MTWTLLIIGLLSVFAFFEILSLRLKMKRELDFSVLSRSLGYYGAKENFLKEKWRKRLSRLDVAQMAFSSLISEFLEDLSIPAENFFLKGDFDFLFKR